MRPADAKTESGRTLPMVWAALVATCALTSVLVVHARAQAERGGAERFDHLVDRAAADSERRLFFPVRGLSALAGLYAASQSVEADEFRTFVSKYEHGYEHPGFVSFGLLGPPPVATTEGFRGFRVLHVVRDAPEARRFEHDPEWNAALEAAVETALVSGGPAITRPLAVSATDRGLALLYVLPVHEGQASGGVLYAYARIDALFAGIEDLTERQIDIDLFDDDSAGRTQLFDSGIAESDFESDALRRHYAGRLYQTTRSLELGGRHFSLTATSMPAFEAVVYGAAPTVLGLGGGLVSIFLVALLWMLEHARGRAIALAHDMTRDLAVARERADLANAAKSAFLANMSHEIRTPLTSMLGYVEMLSDEEPAAHTAPRRAEFLRTIQMAGQHLLAVVNDVLDLSKVDAGSMRVESIETPVVRIAREVVRLMAPRANEKGIELELELSGAVPERVLSDPTRFRQILVNLLGNAVKFTQRGKISVVLGVEARADGNRFCLDVVDTGPGIAQERTGTLFEPFTQADTSVTRRFGGTGLGLALCRRLSELMGGSVELIRTEVDVGSCFRLDLPLATPEGARWIDDLTGLATEESTDAPAPALTLEGRILLVEDNDANRRLISHHLRNAGATVDSAANGRIALELLEKCEVERETIDLILTDVQMPEMDGYTLTRTLRARGCALPIVALTAHALAEDRDECFQAGCSDYLTKPIVRRLLIEACARWMGGSGPAH